MGGRAHQIPTVCRRVTRGKRVDIEVRRGLGEYQAERLENMARPTISGRGLMSVFRRLYPENDLKRKAELLRTPQQKLQKPDDLLVLIHRPALRLREPLQIGPYQY